MAGGGPAPVAVQVFDTVRDRVGPIVGPVIGGTRVGGHVEVRDGRRRVRVLLTWTFVPARGHRSWLLAASPVHRRRRACAAEDRRLVAELLPHLEAALASASEVTAWRWLSEDEARATEL